MDNLILEKAIEISYLTDAIDSVLISQFEFIVELPGLKRIKRGIVHNTVSDILNIELNNPLCLLIRERVRALGGKPYISVGSLYYKNVTRKIL